MSIETIFSFLFLFILAVVLYLERKRLEVQKILSLFKIPVVYMALFKTKLGISQMDSLAKKHPRIFGFLTTVGIYAGLLGMVAISVIMIKNLIDLFIAPEALAGVALVLPFKVAGGFYVPFFYWVLSIFVIATIHEFSHGVAARLHNVHIKSSGFAFLGLLVPVIPAAFVEPDEKILSKKTLKQKLGVYAAGPFSNILTGALFLGLFILLSFPVAHNVIDFDGIKVEGYTANSSAELAGLPTSSIIKQINDVEIQYVENLSQSLKDKKPNEIVSVATTNGTYNVSLGNHPQNSSQPYLGVLVSQHQITKPSFEDKYGKYTAPVILWFLGLLYWLYLLSVGIGLFNLVPLGPVDGGQMSRELFKKFIKNQNTAMKAWHYTSLFFFMIILLNILSGFF